MSTFQQIRVWLLMDIDTKICQAHSATHDAVIGLSI